MVDKLCTLIEFHFHNLVFIILKLNHPFIFVLYHRLGTFPELKYQIKFSFGDFYTGIP